MCLSSVEEIDPGGTVLIMFDLISLLMICLLINSILPQILTIVAFFLRLASSLIWVGWIHWMVLKVIPHLLNFYAVLIDHSSLIVRVSSPFL